MRLEDCRPVRSDGGVHSPPLPCQGQSACRDACPVRQLGNFAGYVDFFHLQDLVDEATSAVKFFTPFADFTVSPLPGTLDAYLWYRQHAAAFVESRNRRIATHLPAGC
jgi:hypothetical protein